MLQDFVDFRKSRNLMLRSRKNQIILEFSYWGGIKPRPGNNIYELRSYVLKVAEYSIDIFISTAVLSD